MIDLEAIRRTTSLVDLAKPHTSLKRSGGGWQGLCPFHRERTPSFTIFADGTRYHCFGCGASGDAFDFVQAVDNVGLIDAARKLANGSLPAEPFRRALMIRPPDPNAARRMAMARAIWDAAIPAAGTIAETYLASRCIAVPVPASVRIALPCPQDGREWPMLVAGIQNANGSLIGIQRTFLAKDGQGKAPVRKPKLSLGSIRGGAIRCGEPGRTLILTEGLEDALSVIQLFGIPAWAAAGSGMLASMRLPFSIRSVIIARDNDPAGERAAQAAAQALSLQGREVRIIQPMDGCKDFNDELKEAIR
ncbi:CHC2 zinc finger domain-containing protein [uncultured Sphingomonas sp.]|uniref:DUF7146 domain-containing protein n=1 Tax=uncultured Sphingomonas sp. TaxID=158754 RepID=UPI0025EB9D45|nr:CHC2 zinc finger domain-containing protein [uncultured Sphingomonas sp.]